MVPVTTTVSVICDGTTARPHLDKVRTAAEYYDKYATSWELTPRFGSGYGSNAFRGHVLEAAPGDDLRLRVTIECPDPECKVRVSPRWEYLHEELDKARSLGYSRIAIKLLEKK